MLFDGFAAALGHHRCALGVDLRENNGKLLPSVAGGKIDGTDRASQDVGDLLDNHISLQRPVGVVEFFEVVDIEHDQGQGRSITMSPGDLLFQVLLERVVGEQFRHSVGRRLPVQIGVFDGDRGKTDDLGDVLDVQQGKDPPSCFGGRRMSPPTPLSVLRGMMISGWMISNCRMISSSLKFSLK